MTTQTTITNLMTMPGKSFAFRLAALCAATRGIERTYY